jgi:hypothetical protein
LAQLPVAHWLLAVHDAPSTSVATQCPPLQYSAPPPTQLESFVQLDGQSMLVPLQT